jgi:hypothetical protein
VVLADAARRYPRLQAQRIRRRRLTGFRNPKALRPWCFARRLRPSDLEFEYPVRMPLRSLATMPRGWQPDGAPRVRRSRRPAGRNWSNLRRMTWRRGSCRQRKEAAKLLLDRVALKNPHPGVAGVDQRVPHLGKGFRAIAARVRSGVGHGPTRPDRIATRPLLVSQMTRWWTWVSMSLAKATT